MGFVISKLLLSLLLPPASLLLLMIAGFLLHRRHRVAGRALAAAGVLLLYLLSIEPVADGLIRPLESAYPPLGTTAVGPRPDAVVVLGGDVRDLSWVPAPPAPAPGTLARLVRGMELARRYRVPLVLSGGSGRIGGSPVREADGMKNAALGLGFPARDILTESRSRNTWENAENVAKLISGRTVVLVTSAYHMARAAAMFRKQGFTVLPAPADYHADSRSWTFDFLVPRAGSLHTSATALAEYLSLSWYRLIGKI